MLVFRHSQRRILNVPILPLAALIGVVGVLIVEPGLRHNVWLYVAGGVVFFITITALSVVTRIDHRVLVRGVVGSEWVPAQDAFLLVGTRGSARGGARIDISLMTGQSSEHQSTVKVLASYAASGLEGPMREAERIARVLGLPPPRLPPWLQPGGIAAPERAATERLTWQNFLSSRWAFPAMFATAVVVALLGPFFVSHVEAELYFRCRTPHQVRCPLGEVLINGSTGFTLEPGEVTVEVWLPDRACWTQQAVSLKRGVKSILDLDELASLNRCDKRDAAPTSPRPGEPNRRYR